MHIPDGFVAPQIYIPAHVVNAAIFTYALKRLMNSLREKTIPYIASLSVFAFILSSVAIPIPGGTSIHGLGVASLSVLFGPWVAFPCIFLILLLEAVLLGEGGITTLSINSLAIGLFGSLGAFYVYRVISKLVPDKIALFLSGFTSALVSAIFIATVLGAHYYLFKDESGRPIYFPFGYSIVFPALVVPHLIVGTGEGFLTYLVVTLLKKRSKL